MAGNGPDLGEIQDRVRSGDYRFTVHAVDRITQRHISASQIEEALLSPQAKLLRFTLVIRGVLVV